ncbi:hypothetical protein [Bradyrhizobium sp. 170]|uniref:hypothetical protein n=1 Tax=Bradyrhizobium sp. 170 TaxID=2782641 RepID=UPI001FFFF23D|nr:hypothetical protein [Bradyrhizobium sp. 170]
MFVRLTRPVRAKAGWFVALIYLFCVLAPGVALAVGDAASCLAHQSGMAAAAHVHDGVQPQHPASHQHHAMQADEHEMHRADTGNATQEHTKHQHDGKGSPGPCCAMLCLSAIAADLPAIAKPSPPISRCVFGNFQHLPGKAPPLLYRPPIA